jgi:hypothetical protein
VLLFAAMPDLLRSAVALVRRGVVFELRLYRSLFRWVARRTHGLAPGVEPFGYARAVTPVMWLWIFGSALEVFFLDLVIPWQPVRVVAFVLGAWGFVWMVGLLASLKVYPHLMSDAGLRLRYGASVDVTVPWQAVETITVDRRDLPSSVRTLQPVETARGTDLQIAVSGQVNVHAALRRPLTVPTPKGDRVVTGLTFLTDDPRALVTRARAHLPSRPGRPTGRG